MGLFGFGKNNNKPTAPTTPTPNYTAAQYVAAGHRLRAEQKWYEAVESYKAAANMSDAEGLYWLGNCVLIGKGAVKDELLACKLYGLAAKMNHREAIDTLFRYLDAIINDSLKTNDFAALSPYLKEGAEAGHLPSVYLYGYFLTVGGGNLQQDRQEGYKWIKIAADNGYDVAKETLEKYY